MRVWTTYWVKDGIIYYDIDNGLTSYIKRKTTADVKFWHKSYEWTACLLHTFWSCRRCRMHEYMKILLVSICGCLDISSPHIPFTDIYYILHYVILLFAYWYFVNITYNIVRINIEPIYRENYLYLSANIGFWSYQNLLDILENLTACNGCYNFSYLCQLRI